MANKKISDLTVAGALDKTEVLPIMQGGVTKQVTLAAVSEVVLNLPVVSAGKTTTGSTDLLINPAVKASGNILDVALNGSSKFKVDSTGKGFFTNGLSVAGGTGIQATIVAPTGDTALSLGSQSTVTTAKNYVSVSPQIRATSDISRGFLVNSNVGTSTVTMEGHNLGLDVYDIYNQKANSAGHNTDLSIYRVETLLGTGKQRMLDLRTDIGAVVNSEFHITNKGHVNTCGRTAPALSDGGVSPSISTGSSDFAGSVLLGSGDPTSCTVTFNSPYVNTPVITVTPLSNVPVYVSAQSKTGFTVTGSATFTGFNYHCIGLNEGNRPSFIAVGDSKTDESYPNTWQATLSANLTTAGHPLVKSAQIALTGSTYAYWDTNIQAKLDTHPLNPKYESKGVSEVNFLVNLGVNDTWAAVTWAATAASVLDKIHATFPTAKVYVTFPWGRTYAAKCAAEKTDLLAIIDARSSWLFAGPDESVWYANGDDGVTYSADGTHYNAAGETANAVQWQTILGY